MSVADILLEQVVRLYSEASNKRSGNSDGFDAALWSHAEELGLPLAMCPDADGGFDLGWSEMFGVLAHASACGEPIPLGETLVANALVCSAGSVPETGPIFFGLPGDSEGDAAPNSARVLVAEGKSLSLAPLAEAMAGGVANYEPGSEFVVQAGALLRAVQIAGALQGALDLAVRYTQERSQFGRPLSKFQAVQHMLAQLASEAVATAAAARMACAKMDAGEGKLAIAIAKLRAGRAVEKGVMLAHQIHGAMGVTLEYPLARLSLNMWRWSEEFGDQKYWAIAVGRAGMAMPSAWDAVVSASDPVGVAGYE